MITARNGRFGTILVAKAAVLGQKRAMLSSDARISETIAAGGRRAAALSPRQTECLRLVWERRATSKEVAIELGISKTTVDGYISEAVELLGARDRRDAARIAFGEPRAGSGGDAVRVTDLPDDPASASSPTTNPAATRPWRSPTRPANTLTFAQTMGWIAIIATISLLALALATIIGNGVPPVAHAVLGSFDRLTR